MSHLLVVEDDDDLREDLAELLRMKGFAVRTAANGAEALDDLRAAPKPCLILLDLMMPVMDGWRFREEQLRDQTLASLPVVVVSGVADQTAALQAHALLRKPVKLPELLQLVGSFCQPAA